MVKLKHCEFSLFGSCPKRCSRQYFTSQIWQRLKFFLSILNNPYNWFNYNLLVALSASVFAVIASRPLWFAMAYAQWGKSHCSQVMPYGIINIGHYRFKKWLVTWQNQTITVTTVQLSTVRPCGIRVREMCGKYWNPSTKYVTKITEMIAISLI